MHCYNPFSENVIISLNDSKKVVPNSVYLGNVGENNVLKLTVNYPDRYQSGYFRYFMRYNADEKSKDLEIFGGSLLIPCAVTATAGNHKAQIVITSNSGTVWLSDVFTYTIGASICGKPPEFRPPYPPCNPDFPVPPDEIPTQDYNALSNKPCINGVTLEGDKSGAELGLAGNGMYSLKDLTDVSNNYQPETVTIYVDGADGSDESGEGTLENPYQSVNFELHKIPSIPTDYYVVRARNIENQDVLFKNFSGAGGGAIWLASYEGGGNLEMGNLTITNCNGAVGAYKYGIPSNVTCAWAPNKGMYVYNSVINLRSFNPIVKNVTSPDAIPISVDHSTVKAISATSILTGNQSYGLSLMESTLEIGAMIMVDVSQTSSPNITSITSASSTIWLRMGIEVVGGEGKTVNKYNRIDTTILPGDIKYPHICNSMSDIHEEDVWFNISSGVAVNVGDLVKMAADGVKRPDSGDLFIGLVKETKGGKALVMIRGYAELPYGADAGTASPGFQAYTASGAPGYLKVTSTGGRVYETFKVDTVNKIAGIYFQ